MSFIKEAVIIANVAINGSNIVESIKDGHVTYSIEVWGIASWSGGGTDANGDPIPPTPNYGWIPSGSGSTGAKITGTVSVPSSTFKVGGVNVAKVGDTTNETWEAYPPIPSNDGSTLYTATSPTSGSGQGLITGGNGKNAKLNGQLIATVGSQVTTCLGNTTTIEDGNSLISL